MYKSIPFILVALFVGFYIGICFNHRYDDLKQKKYMNWININTKPLDRQKIIIESPVGMQWAVFYDNERSGVQVYNSNHDWIDWTYINRWIPYPND